MIWPIIKSDKNGAPYAASQSEDTTSFRSISLDLFLYICCFSFVFSSVRRWLNANQEFHPFLWCVVCILHQSTSIDRMIKATNKCSYTVYGWTLDDKISLNLTHWRTNRKEIKLIDECACYHINSHSKYIIYYTIYHTRIDDQSNGNEFNQ